jgi:hypothetical protein
VRDFRKLTIGGVMRDVLLERLAAAGVGRNAYAERLLAHPSFTPEAPPETLTLVKTTLAELGLVEPCSFRDVVARAESRGLRICPLVTAAFLRLDYLDQEPGPYLTVASPPPGTSEEHPTGFYLRNLDGALWLRGYRALDACEWPAGNEFVFRR